MHDFMMWSDENAHSESVALVFADQKEYKSRVGTIYDLYAQPKTWGNRLSSLTFMQSSNCAALQAADLVAYECYRHMHSRLTDPEYENQPLRPRLRKMLDSGMDHRGRLNDNKLLEELLAQKHKRYL